MWRTIALFGAITLAIAVPGRMTGQDAATADVTFNKDVAPIFYEKCVYCHRPGEIGPMPLLTYRDARPWARGIRQEVLQRRMPPWRADPHYEQYVNDRTLSDREIQTIVAWVNAGTKEGNPADLPAPPQFADGWQIGTPDLILTMKEPYTVAASGEIPMVSAPSNDFVFPEDKWIQAVEVRPGNRRVVHHAVALVTPPRDSECQGGNNLHLYSPGMEAMIWRDGYGKRMCKGTRLSFGMHYNSVGTPQTDQTRIGLKFATKPVHTEVRTSTVGNAALLVPPNARRHEVMAAYQFRKDSRIYALRPHMHLRGKTGSATAIAPTGKRRVLLHVPDWDDGWQNYYMLSEPAGMPGNSIIEWLSNYDNSAANPFNPDPKVPVVWGDQVWEEMHAVYMTWVEINDANRNDLAPINVPINKAFTTGVAGSR